MAIYHAQSGGLIKIRPLESMACTIGHSSRPIEEFVGLLWTHEVAKVIDVRTIPRRFVANDCLFRPHGPALGPMQTLRLFLDDDCCSDPGFARSEATH
jgi:hypothetical protein